MKVDAAAGDGLEGDTIVLADGDVQRLALIADVLAKSVVLARTSPKLTRRSTGLSRWPSI